MRRYSTRRCSIRAATHRHSAEEVGGTWRRDHAFTGRPRRWHGRDVCFQALSMYPPPPRPHGPALHGPLDLLSTAPAEQEACCNGRHRRRCGGRPEPSPRRCRRRSHPAQAGGRVERVRARGCACGPRIAPRRATGHSPPPLDCSYVIPCPLPSCITTRGNNTLWWPTCEPSLPAAAVPGALRWGWRCTGLGCCVQEEVPPW